MREKLRTLDLFAGIGGISLGLERTGGFETVGFCEINPFSQQVLKKHWPHVPLIADVKEVKGDEFGHIDVLTGGYPCQPFSLAGRRGGKDDPRHLWPEVARIIRTVRPAYVLLENVTGHLSLGFGRVLGDLAESGYDAEWDCIPASAIGAAHRRDRVFVVAYTERPRRKRFLFSPSPERTGSTALGWVQGQWRESGASFDLAPRNCLAGLWSPTPDVPRVLDGVPTELDAARVTALGNAVVPQVAEYMGGLILAAEAAR